MGRLDDKVAIITGAGQGIGLAYAERFLAEGAKVVVAEVVEERAAGAMKELEGKGESIFVKTDISDPDSARMTFVVMETVWSDASTSAPVVTECFNLIARLKK